MMTGPSLPNPNMEHEQLGGSTSNSSGSSDLHSPEASTLSHESELVASPTVRTSILADIDIDAEPTGLQKAIHPSKKYEKRSSPLQMILGILYVTLVVFSSLLDVVWIVVPVQLLLPQRLATRVLRHIEPFYFSMMSGLLEVTNRMKLVVTTENSEAGPMTFADTDHVLLISNHRTEVDWVYFWNFAMRFNCHDRLRVMMKSIIRYAPGAGWALLMLDFPFVNRSWATDEARIRNKIASYKMQPRGTWLCMFPEGTNLYEKSLARSHTFAKSRGENPTYFVLYPRVRGFELCAEVLEPEWIVDLTMGYPELSQGVAPSPLRFLCGQYPPEVHIHVRRYHKSELAKYHGSMDEWVKERFVEKEKLLQNFYENDAFLGKKPLDTDNSPSIGWLTTLGFLMHLIVLAWTVVAFYYYPYVTLIWGGCCSVLAIYLVHAFGRETSA